jgi:hypothetical protein
LSSSARTAQDNRIDPFEAPMLQKEEGTCKP